MTQLFGEVAALYDEVRPGYPDGVREMILDYAGSPASIVELGAGTGKGTEVLVGLGKPLTALEPDPRMAAVLRAKFPQITIETTTFEAWTPYGETGLISCASAWHWMDAATRNRRAFDLLAPGGVMTIFQHKYAYVDPEQDRAISEVLAAVDRRVPVRGERWVLEDVREAGLWNDVEERLITTYPVFEKQRYLDLTQTFSPFRRHHPDVQRRLLDDLSAALTGPVALELRTSVVLSRKR
ncbi:methyltransferase domain-containing protein [Actinoplanes bogorensis]|uniref:Methyltransferase domain-containing protein n=1 Tax=Paractinoplanes bogorensis TaxID=1610840 RepID=A0ABS5Z5Q0_9ACTN|nr:methyltransferase domain-containing protein [Actinoplanes bogorensis]MBU2671032.1 methyltransferase domain-containing protein [Actinoplanes bogorensis]